MKNIGKLIARNPLRIFSLFWGWIFSMLFVDSKKSPLPVIFDTPGLGISLWKKRTGRLIINGELIIQKRGARRPYGNVHIEIYEGSTLIINGTVILGAGVHLLVGPGATMILGSKENGRITASHGTEIIANQHIEIRSGCMLSWDVLIMDTNLHPILEPATDIHSPVTIEEDVWIGGRAIILKGVTVNTGAIIGTGALVTRDVPAKTAVGGNPAKVVKEGVVWRE